MKNFSKVGQNEVYIAIVDTAKVLMEFLADTCTDGEVEIVRSDRSVCVDIEIEQEFTTLDPPPQHNRVAE